MSVLTLLGRPRRSTSKRRRRVNVLDFQQFDRLEERMLLSTISQTQSFGPSGTNIVSQPLGPALSQFDTQGGLRVLDSVEIQVKSDVTSTLSGSITNNSGNQAAFFSATVENADTEADGLDINGVTNSTSVLLSSGPFTIAAGTTFQIPSQTQVLSASGDFTVNGAGLAAFIGTGTLSNYTTSAAADAHQSLTGSSNVDANIHFATTGEASVTLIYTFHNVTNVTTVPGGPVVIGSGNKLTDTATLSGGASPTGSINFVLTLNGTQVDSEIVTVNGNGQYTTPNGYLPTQTGTYQWVATYSGDTNNSGSASLLGDEPEVVNPASPAINTVPGGAVVIGSGAKLTDTATLSGGFSPTGTIDFILTLNGSQVDSEVVTVNGNGQYSTPNGYLPVQTGTYQWVANYSGDTNNNPINSNLGDEPETVTPATPSISTLQLPTTAVVGSSIADQATVSGGFNPTGTVTFKLFNNAGGLGTPLFTDTEGLVNGTATSAGFTTTVTGTDYWVDTYNGDSNNNPVTSGLTAEPVTITPSITTISTVPGGTVAVGSGVKMNDTAVLAGGVNPTGTITFQLFSGLTVVYTDHVTVNGNGPYSTTAGDNAGGFLPTVSGTYQWVANYSGDTNNGGSGSGLGSEPENAVNANITITPLTPVNEVKHAEVFTVTVNAFPAGTGAPSFGPLVVTTTGGLIPTTSGPTLSNGGNTATWTVTINSNTAGVFAVQTADTVTMGGVAVTRTTGDNFTSPEGNDSPSALKNYVDALITISPLTPVNPVGSPETFTVTITAFPATTGVPSFGIPTFSVTPAPSTVTSTPLVISPTNFDVATFTITINSNAPGTFTVTAGDTVTMGGVAVTRNTGDGFTSGDGSDSPNAIKTYISPLTPALTWGFWKNHDGTGPQADAWPIGVFNIATGVKYVGVDVGGIAEGTFTVGGHTYSADDVRNVFNKSVKGNVVIELGHQLFAAILNAANGAADSTDVAEIKAASDLLAANSLVIGVSIVTQGSNAALYNQLNNLAAELEAFNASGV
jgi:hypothetical protein